MVVQHWGDDGLPLASKQQLTASWPNRGMNEYDLSQPAIVFWEPSAAARPGDIARFERLDEAIHTVMQAPSATTASVAWISIKDRHLAMDEIRQLAGRFNPTRRKPRASGAHLAGAAGGRAKKKKRFHWPEPAVPPT